MFIQMFVVRIWFFSSCNKPIHIINKSCTQCHASKVCHPPQGMSSSPSESFIRWDDKQIYHSRWHMAGAIPNLNRGASLPYSRYHQTILLSDRDTCVNNFSRVVTNTETVDQESSRWPLDLSSQAVLQAVVTGMVQVHNILCTELVSRF